MFFLGWFQNEFITLKSYCLTRSSSLPPLSFEVCLSDMIDWPRSRVKVEAAEDVTWNHLKRSVSIYLVGIWWFLGEKRIGGLFCVNVVLSFWPIHRSTNLLDGWLVRSRNNCWWRSIWCRGRRWLRWGGEGYWSQSRCLQQLLRGLFGSGSLRRLNFHILLVIFCNLASGIHRWLVYRHGLGRKLALNLGRAVWFLGGHRLVDSPGRWFWRAR